LEKNGKASSGHWTCHLDIYYFFVTDWVKKGDLYMEYCPTGDMWGTSSPSNCKGVCSTNCRRSFLIYLMILSSYSWANVMEAGWLMQQHHRSVLRGAMPMCYEVHMERAQSNMMLYVIIHM
jgi:hypothetical protein